MTMLIVVFRDFANAPKEKERLLWRPHLSVRQSMA
jgi:hypothetical protein